MRQKLSNLIFWLLFASVFLCPFLIEYSYVFQDLNLNPFDYARITDVDYKAVVVDEPGSEGKVVITERLTFDIHAASKNNLFWELWRDLPEDYVDGVKVDYQVNSVKQILPDGTEVIYEESPKLYWDDEDYLSTNSRYGPGKWYHSEGPYDEYEEQYECVFFYVDGLYREEVVFEIEYEMYNAALRYNDCSDLYLSLYSESTINYLESFKAQILFPLEDMPAPGNYDVYTYGTNSNDFPVSESDTLNPGYYTFYFELDEDQLQFRPYNEYIEFDLVSHGEDKHIFTDYAPSNYYTYDNVLGEIYAEQLKYSLTPAYFTSVKISVLLVLSIIAVLVLIYSFTAGPRTRAKYIFYKPAMEMQYFRDIPNDLDPNFAAALVFCKKKAPKDDSGIYSAILLSLARKKYITLTEYGAADVLVTITKQEPPIPQPEVQPNTGLDADLAATLFSLSIDATPAGTSLGETQSNIALDATPSGTTSEEPYEAYEPLTRCEEYYFNLLVRHANGDNILMSTFQQRVSSDYENTDAFATNVKNSVVNIGVRDGYFQKADYAQPKNRMNAVSTFLMVIGIIFIVFVNIFSYSSRVDLAFGAFFIMGISCVIGSIYLRQQSKKYVLLTQFGEDEYAKWRGLYNFLNSETLIHERTIIELPLWEKYLVYATAFGLSEKVIKAISIRCPEVASSPVLRNDCYRSRSFHRSSRSFRSAVRSGSSVARSGGGGGGFGYGGGGRGGGGGGGGH